MAKLSPEQFCYWLQGFMEMQNPDELDCKQTQIIKDHLNEVFDKVTPSYGSMPKGFKKLEPKVEEKQKGKSKRVKIKMVAPDLEKVFPDFEGRHRNRHRDTGSLLVC